MTNTNTEDFVIESLEQVTTKPTTKETKTMTTTTESSNKAKAATKQSIKEAIKNIEIKEVASLKVSYNKAIEYIKGLSIKKAYDSAKVAYSKVKDWLTYTKLGRATAYTIKATTVLTAVGFFVPGPILAITISAITYTTASVLYKAVRNKEDLSLKSFFKALAINTLSMTGLLAGAYLLTPLFITALSYVIGLITLATAIPMAAVAL